MSLSGQEESPQVAALTSPQSQALKENLLSTLARGCTTEVSQEDSRVRSGPKEDNNIAASEKEQLIELELAKLHDSHP